MPMIPPLVREPPSAEPRTPGTPRAPFTGHPVSARMARPQRRYASNYNISFMHEPPKPMARPEPEPAPAPRPEGTFDQWRAVAEAERLGIGAAEPPDAAMPTPALRQRLHDALLGTTAVVLLGVLGGIVYYAWAHDGPEVAAPVGTASKGSGLSAFVQPLWTMAAKMGPQAASDRTPAPASGEDAVAEGPSLRQALQPAAPPPPSVTPDAPAPATLSADKPALAVPAAFGGASTPAAEAVPTPERAAAPPFPLAVASESGTAAPAPAAPSEARPAPEQAAMTRVLPGTDRLRW